MSLSVIARGNTVDATGLVLGVAFFSYIYGIVPALVTGYIAGLLVRTNGLLHFALCGATGFATSFLFCWLVWESYLYDWRTALFRMAVPGLLGGLFCGALSYRAFRNG